MDLHYNARAGPRNADQGLIARGSADCQDRAVRDRQDCPPRVGTIMTRWMAWRTVAVVVGIRSTGNHRDVVGRCRAEWKPGVMVVDTMQVTANVEAVD